MRGPRRGWAGTALAAFVIVILVLAGCSGNDDGTGLPAAPEFELTSSRGQRVSLSGVLQQHDSVAIVFYRGFF